MSARAVDQDSAAPACLAHLRRWMARASREDPPFRPFAPKRILVVGCGSDLPFSVAAEQPDAEVLGIDEDPAIVAVAEEAAAQAALPNLAFLAADLGDSSSVPGDFDWIHCPDAVKPFGDEASAWRTLAQHLAGNGLLTARLRSRRQEYAGDNFREAINILAQAEPPADLDDWLRLGHRLARDLGQGATPLGPISRTVAARLRQTPPHVAASALLPAGHAHTPDSFRALLTKAGLAQYGFLDEEAWRPEGIIDAPDILALIDGLSRDERDEVVDILRAPDLLLVCGHPRPEKEQMPSRPSGSTTDGGVRPSRAGLDDALAGAARLHGSGDLPGAETICRQILSGVPGHPGALDLLGRIAHQRGDHPAALEFIGRAIAAEPSEPSHHGNLGVVYQAAGELGRASECMTTALALRPDSPEAHNNLGTVLQAQGKLEEALAQYREALRRRPDMAEGHRNLGTLLQAQGRHQEALAQYREALRLRPEYVQAHLNYAQTSLLMGNFAQGWAEYEWRWKLGRTAPCPFSQPRWDGAPLEGGTILLHAEQGLGDTLQFVRYAHLVHQRGGTVIVQCQPPLAGLLATCAGVGAVIPEGEPLPPFDVHAPLLSLPGIFRTALDSIPADVPYLSPPPGDVPALDALLAPRDGRLQVGIVWGGSPSHKNDPERSCPLLCFRDLARQPGVTLVSLQKGPRAAELDDVKAQMAVTDLRTILNDFAEAAAAIAQLDLVISVDTAVAHLAGALGKPVWLLLPFAPDWRWMLDREDSPWYPSMRLFRQTRPGDWPGVFERVYAALLETTTSQSLSREAPQDTRSIPSRQAGSPTSQLAVPASAAIPAAVPLAPAGEAAADDAISLPSALRLDNGQPRFRMRVPSRLRSDPGAVFLAEHETKFGGYEYPSRRFLDLHLQPGDIFIDVGAHWGIYTLTAATRWPGKVAVLAVEPVPENAAILGANLACNHVAAHVEIVEAAAGAAAGRAAMFPHGSMGHSLYPAGTAARETIPVAVVTLDELMAGRPPLQGRRLFLKIDAEGHEPEVVQGAHRLIESGVVAAIIWEKGGLYDQEPHAQRMRGMIEYLRGRGFAQFRFPHENLGGSLIPFVLNHERCNVFALAPGFPIAASYDKPAGLSAPAVPAAPNPITPVERAALTKTLAALRGSDGGRWADPANLSPDWDGRAACVAQRIPRGAHVLDVGAGAMALRRFLDTTVRYTPADIVAREPGCLVTDLNQGQFPDGHYDYVTMLGVLEYVHDVAAVLRRARGAAPRVIFTYSLYAGGHLDARRSAGWFNDYTAQELTALLAETKWQVTSLEAIENDQVILSCRDGQSSGLSGFPVVPDRKRVLVMGYQNAANFGDRLGYHLIPGLLPSHCDVSFGTFQPWHVPEGPYDLAIVGIGNSLFGPLLSDDLQRLVEAVPQSIGIFGTQYRDSLPADRLRRLVSALTCWYARSEEDIFLYGSGHQNIHHLGDWLSLLCPMGTPSLAKELVIPSDFIQTEAPLDRVIQEIQTYQQVHSARIHPLLVALHSASAVSYAEQREMGDGQVSGKFRSLLLDVFERCYPERETFAVNRHLVSAYQARVRANYAQLAATIQSLLGDGKWRSSGGG